MTILLCWGQSIARAASTQVTLAPTTGPTDGQPGVTSITLTGSNYPGGTISPGDVQINLTPAAGSTVSVSPSAVTTVFGSSRRLIFTIPTSISVTSPTPYLVSVSGQTAAGVPFISANSSTLTVNPPAEITAILPAIASPGQSLSVTITGLSTTFTQNSTVASFGPGISVGGAPSGTAGPVNVVSQTMVLAQIVVDPAAAPGLRNVSIQTGLQIASFPNSFTINGSPASILLVTPNTGTQGQQNLTVTIAGQNTHWTQGSTVAAFGTGVSIVSLTVVSSVSVNAIISIDPAASPGPRSVTLTTDAEVAALNNGFIITTGAPSLISVDPNSGRQGTQNLSIHLTGQNTHWSQGNTVADFGTGVTVQSLTVGSATSATALVNISPDLNGNNLLITYYTIAESDRDSNHLANGNFDNEVKTQLGPHGLPVLNTGTYGCTLDCYASVGAPTDVLANGEITYWSPALNNGGPGGSSDVIQTGTAIVTLPFSVPGYFFPPNGTGGSDFNGYQAAVLSGTLTNASDETLAFSIGADDMAFAFLDGTKVCDLGGVHGFSQGTCVAPFTVAAGVHSL